MCLTPCSLTCSPVFQVLTLVTFITMADRTCPSKGGRDANLNNLNVSLLSMSILKADDCYFHRCERLLVRKSICVWTTTNSVISSVENSVNTSYSSDAQPWEVCWNIEFYLPSAAMSSFSFPFMCFIFFPSFDRSALLQMALHAGWLRSMGLLNLQPKCYEKHH